MTILVHVADLPEHNDYRDTGCEIHHACLSCPLPACKHDEPGILARIKREQRDQEIIRMIDLGMSDADIAKQVSVSAQTVLRSRSRLYKSLTRA